MCSVRTALTSGTLEKKENIEILMNYAVDQSKMHGNEKYTR